MSRLCRKQSAWEFLPKRAAAVGSDAVRKDVGAYNICLKKHFNQSRQTTARIQ